LKAGAGLALGGGAERDTAGSASAGGSTIGRRRNGAIERVTPLQSARSSSLKRRLLMT
jgi:hypothetical protein